MHSAVRLALQPFKDASYSPLQMKVPAQRQGVQGYIIQRLVPLLVVYNADIPEARVLGNINNTAYPIVTYLVPKEELDNITQTWPLRTEQKMKEVSPLPTVPTFHLPTSTAFNRFHRRLFGIHSPLFVVIVPASYASMYTCWESLLRSG